MRVQLKEEGRAVWGRLALRVYKKGHLVREDIEHNVLTNDGKVQWLKRLIDGSTATGLDRVEVGDGGCAQTALFVPLPFVGTDTDLRSSIGVTASLEGAPVVDIGDRTVTYRAILSSSQANDEDFHYEPRVINEIALKTAAPDNVAVALRAFKSISFGSGDAIDIEAVWTLGLI